MKSSREDDGAPHFPLPRKREEPSPYRKAGAAPAGPAAEPAKPVVVVSRPDPPAPAAPRPRSAPKPPPATPKPPPAAIVLGDAGLRSAGRSRLAAFMARYPRLLGLGLLVLGAWSFESSVVSDHRAYLERAGRFVYVHKAWSFQLSLGIAAFGLWLLIWGIPMDSTTGRPRDSWTLGAFIVIVLALAARGRLTDMVIAAFA